LTQGAALPANGSFDPGVVAWDPWRPDHVARLLAGVDAPWCVAAGWAIDLFLGSQQREHDDIEIAVPADRFGQVAEALSDLELFVVGSGLATPLADAGGLFESSHQTWVLERASAVWRLDVFREPSAGDSWIYRRDERLRLPYDELIERTSDGIPYARPEVVLLFKAKAARPKDDGDFAAVVPLLDAERRRWLVEALALVHPGHRWLAELQG
jgi:hypothetical protein